MHISLDSALGRQRRLNSVGESVFQIAPDAAAGYSLRSLTGGDPSVVRVRRESDNGERDFRSSEINSGSMVRWVNEQITPPLDLRELTATGRDGPIIEAAAAYSLRNLSDSYAGDVVEVRRNTDGALKDFKASEVTDGTLEAWVNTSFANALPLDTASGAAAAYSLRNLSSSYTGSVVEVRRIDGTVRSFTAAEVTDGTLVAWVNEDPVAQNSTSIPYSTFTNASTTGFTATLSSGVAFAGFGGVSGSNGNSVTVAFDLDIVSGSPFLALREGTGLINSKSNNQVYTSSGSYSLTMTATGNFAFIGFSEDDNPSEYTVSNFRITAISGATYDRDGTVSKWYDQSGNDNHATQGTPASQPKIVDGGSLVSGGIDFASDFLVASSVSGLTGSLSMLSVSERDFSGNVVSLSNSSSGGRYFAIQEEGSSATINIRNPTTVNVSSNVSVSTRLTFALTTGATSTSVGANGSAVTTTSNDYGDDFSGTDINQIAIGVLRTVSPGAYFNGRIKEVIIYNTDQSDKRRAIEENIGSNYGITLTSSKDGTVSKWYDQSTTSGTPNANHAVQTDAAKQPKIVNAGVYLGELDFDGTNDNLALSGSGLDLFRDVGYGQIFSVITPDNVSTGSNRYFEAVSGSSGARLLLGDSQDYAASSRIGGRRLDADGFQDIESPTSHSNNETLITGFLNWADADAYLYLNGTERASSTGFQTAGNTSNTSSAETSIGGVSTSGDFKTKEIIIYTTDQSANRTALEANIGEVYGIAGIPAYDDTVNGFVETWYDQSGNGNDATQSVAANQPKIVNAGALVTGGLDFDGTDFFSTSLVPTSAATLIGVATWDGVGGMIVGARDSQDERSYMSRGGTTPALILGVGPNGLSSGSITLEDESLAFGTYSGTTANASLNGVNTAFTGITAPVNTTYGYRIGTLNSFGANVATMNGRIREVIIYPTDQSANRLAIEANINNQYSIY